MCLGLNDADHDSLVRYLNDPFSPRLRCERTTLLRAAYPKTRATTPNLSGCLGLPWQRERRETGLSWCHLFGRFVSSIITQPRAASGGDIKHRALLLVLLSSLVVVGGAAVSVWYAKIAELNGGAVVGDRATAARSPPLVKRLSPGEAWPSSFSLQKTEWLGSNAAVPASPGRQRRAVVAVDLVGAHHRCGLDTSNSHLGNLRDVAFMDFYLLVTTGLILIYIQLPTLQYKKRRMPEGAVYRVFSMVATA